MSSFGLLAKTRHGHIWVGAGSKPIVNARLHARPSNTTKGGSQQASLPVGVERQSPAARRRGGLGVYLLPARHASEECVGQAERLLQRDPPPLIELRIKNGVAAGAIPQGRNLIRFWLPRLELKRHRSE
jgi:hypothetical protein